ncbi:myb-like protein K [Macrobrachium rosenbergii]|uniref:myb-like protein K n=1 Tax=Macrobrachium rosenbergii TaxID=79674 RepID=UPI0034D3FED2
MSFYVASVSKTSTLPQAPTSQNKQDQCRTISTKPPSHNVQHRRKTISSAQVRKMKVHRIIPISGIQPFQSSEDSSTVQSRKRAYQQEFERTDNATSNNKVLGQTYESVPAKRICRVNVTKMVLDNQNPRVLKQTSGFGPATAVPVVSLQRNLSSLVPKESPAFVSTTNVPVVLVPVQLIMQQQQQQKQQQSKNVLPTTLPEQDDVQPTSLPPTASQLQQEIKVLKERKKDLLHRLSLFHQLFRNKERLKTVVRRLGVEIE